MNHSPMHQAARYGLVGVCVFATDFLGYWTILQALPGAWLAANIAGKSTGALLGFLLHRHFTFSWQHRDGGARQLIAYICLFTANLALSSGLLWLLVEGAHLNDLVAKVLADVVVIATSFVVSRTWVYRAA